MLYRTDGLLGKPKTAGRVPVRITVGNRFAGQPPLFIAREASKFSELRQVNAGTAWDRLLKRQLNTAHVEGPVRSEVTRILYAIEQGDPHAAEELLPLVYDELRRLAARKIGREAPGQTLDATAFRSRS